MSTQSLASALLRPRAGDPALDDRYFVPMVPTSVAGVTVSADTALMVSAIYRCVALLSNAFASLPMGVFRNLERGRESVDDHPARYLFTRRPNPYQRPLEFKRLMMSHVVLRGNAFARIYQRRGETELWPLHPDRVQGPELLNSGRLRYLYTRPDNGQQETYIGGVDILHVPGLSSDGLRGLALTDKARETVGIALAAERHGARAFGQGVKFAGVLKTDKTLQPGTREAMETSFALKYGGEAGAMRVPILEQGLEFQAVGMSNEDAQWLETRKFTVSDIARWFGVPPHMVGDVERSTSWGTGIEHQSIQFVQYGLMPWLVQWEEVIKDTFIVEEDLYARFNVEGLLRADAKTRHTVYAIGIKNGIYSPDECREFENRNPRPGGDQYVDVANIKGGGNATTPTNGQAEALAARLASAVVRREREGLARGAVQHAKSDEKWRAFVPSFYGRFRSTVAGEMGCSPAAAARYCDEHRDLILAEGVEALDDERAEGELVALVLED